MDFGSKISLSQRYPRYEFLWWCSERHQKMGTNTAAIASEAWQCRAIASSLRSSQSQLINGVRCNQSIIFGYSFILNISKKQDARIPQIAF
jgi:hypothetical protein